MNSTRLFRREITKGDGLRNSSISEKEFWLEKTNGNTEYLKKLCCNSIINHHHLDAQLIIEKINKNTIIISREQHLFNHESFFVGWVGSFNYFKQVLLVCHKNKWRDLWRKIVAYLFLFLWGWTRKHFNWSKIFLGPVKIFSCPPSKNKKHTAAALRHKSRYLFLWYTNRTRLL